MYVHRWIASATAFALLAAGLVSSISRSEAQNGAVDVNANDSSAQVLTRGPIHEAFGQPVVFNPTPGLTVSKKAPNPIEEMPPDQKPEGDNVVWIHGYWGWDADNANFLWVSGFWRRLPPDRQWVPGYWAQLDNGNEWVSGYWAPATQTQVTYLPQAPPESVEVGPSTEAPAANRIWVPGIWMWIDNRYVWRPGYWIEDQPGWVWCPAEYNWTPGGYIFVDGYWDYSPRQRGLLFAPLLLNAFVGRPGYVWRPDVVLDTNLVTDYLFAAPRYHHYYFGDYYAPNYLNDGIYPWFSFHQSHYGYDPIFAYYSTWYGRNNDQTWITRQRQDYFARRDHAELRPARTLAAQQTLINNNTNINNTNINNTTINRTNVDNRSTVNTQTLMLAQPLAQVVKEAGTDRMPLRFQRVDQTRLADVTKHQEAARQVASERQRTEVQMRTAKAAVTGDKAAQPLTRQLPQTPFVGKAGPATAKAQAPPAPPAAPKVNAEAKVQPNPTPRLKPEEHLNQIQKTLPQQQVTPQGVPGKDLKPAPKVETPKAPPAPKVEATPPAPKVETPKAPPAPKAQDLKPQAPEAKPAPKQEEPKAKVTAPPQPAAAPPAPAAVREQPKAPPAPPPAAPPQVAQPPKAPPPPPPPAAHEQPKAPPAPPPPHKDGKDK